MSIRGQRYLAPSGTLLAMVLVTLAVSHLRGQAPAAAAQGAAAGPQFEVATIKPNKSGDGRIMIGNQPGGRVVATNVTLRTLIMMSYQLQPASQIIGGPAWLNSDHFDIVAKAPAELVDDRIVMPAPGQGPTVQQLMIRALLADRFKLVVHTESREQPIYALVLARSDGRLGPKLTRSTTDCAALLGRGRGAPPPVPPDVGQRMQCGMRIGPGTLVAGAVSMGNLASSLSQPAQRMVLDRTGLTGNYDIDLSWTPDQILQRPAGSPEPQINGASIDPNGPSIYTAVEEQLGLKLDSTRGPVDVFIIDRAEQPTEN